MRGRVGGMGRGAEGTKQNLGRKVFCSLLAIGNETIVARVKTGF